MTLAELENSKAQSLVEIAAAGDASAIEALRVKYVVRNGSIPALIKGMKDVPKEERPAFGKAVQAWRAEVEAALAAKSGGAGAEKGVEADLTLPGRWFALGAKHPLSRVIEETARIFGRLGFTVADGPELENRFNNFTALNTPPHHPSMDRSDTFWFDGDTLLRTQTSPVQIRTMMANKPPIRVICPGRTYRRDTTDATHSANFHQIEGLYVDTKPVSLADLKSVLAYFAHEMMGDGVTVRFRPHFFRSPSLRWRWTSVAISARARGAACARIRAGSRLPARGWLIRESSNTSATTTKRSPVTRSASASSVSL